MLKKIVTTKSIPFIALATALFGFSAELFPKSTVSLFFIRNIFSTVALSLFERQNILSYNYLNISFYVILLFGALFYWFSQQRESRLIRFCFSIICFSKILFLLFWLFSAIFNPEFSIKSMFWQSIVYITSVAGWIAVSYLILKHFFERKELHIDISNYGDDTITTLRFASRWQRFFNITVDSLVIAGIFSFFFIQLTYYSSFNAIIISLQETIGERAAFYLVIIVFRTVYYLSFEHALGATPAKLLSETRVVKDDGSQPGFKRILGRTFYRYVPFEPFSFLGSANGWHDNWSGTSVVQEKRTGVKGWKYMLIFPVVLLVGGLAYFGQEKYSNYQSRKLEQQLMDFKKQQLVEKLDNATTRDIFELQEKNNYSQRIKVFLKVEKNNADSILFKRIITRYTYNLTHYDIEAAYNDKNDTLKSFVFSKKALYNALMDREYDTDFAGINIDGVSFGIKDIESYFMPGIQFADNQGYSPGTFSIYLVNKGWEADIIGIKVLDGDINITTQLPLHVPASIGNSSGYSFTITGTPDAKDMDYKINLEVTDTTGKHHTFQLKGNTRINSFNTAKRLK